MSYYRSLYHLLLSRMSERSPKIQAVIGPRQVGKTTAIRQFLQNMQKEGPVYQSADSPTPLEPSFIEKWWAEAKKFPDPILVIDEIQKIPGWSETVKRLWDADPIKLVLSGSAALAIEKNLKESLAGRYELIRAEHWNFEEAKEVFGISANEFIEGGCYPGSMALKNDVERWAEYVRDSIIEPVIGRDIIQIHPVNNPALLRQLFGLCASLPAQIVSLNKLQGKLQDRGAIATLQHYLTLLEQSFLVTGLQKFSDKKIRTRTSSPKIIVHDNALMRSLERPVRAPLKPELFGHYFENLVGARFVEAGWDTYYWNDRNLDVDFVVVGPNGEKWAIEVKTSLISPQELKGLNMFCKTNPQFEPHLISLVGQKIPGIQSLDAQWALSLTRYAGRF